MVEGEPASNERTERMRDGWEWDEGLLPKCIIKSFVIKSA